MTGRKLAWIFFRCSGVISIVLGIFHFVAYLPMLQELTWAKGTSGFLLRILLPAGAEVIGGLVLFLLAKSLSRAVVPAADDERVA